MRLESIAFGVTYLLTNALLLMLTLQPLTVSSASQAMPVAKAQNTSVAAVA